MVNIEKLTDKALADLAKEIQKEKVKRTRINLAQTDIRKALKKHEVSIDEINIKEFVLRDKPKKKPKSPALSGRTHVKPKYHNPKGSERWSGRGRAPSWVVQICEENKISLAEFKKKSEFSV